MDINDSKIKKFNAQFLNTSEYIVLFSYFILIVSRVMLFTSIVEFMPVLTVTLKYVAFCSVSLIACVYLVNPNKTWRQIVCLCLGFGFAFFEMYKTGLQNNFSMALILGLSLFGVNCTLRKIAYTQGVGMLIGSCIPILLSLVHVLPKSGFASRVSLAQSTYQETEYFFGFNHPNSFGVTLTMGILLFCLGKSVSKSKMLIILVGCIFMDYFIGADTVMVAAIVILLGLILTPLRNKLYLYGCWVTRLLFVILPLLCIWLGINSGTAIGQKVSNIIASRPPIWNYYLLLNPIKLIANPPKLDLSIASTGVIGNGALDGAYIYTLVYWGVLALILLIVGWLIWIPFKKNPSEFQWLLLLFIFVVTVMNFSESHMLSYYENTFVLGVGLLQYSSSKRSILINDWYLGKGSHENIN
ncbi:hypothetical protein [Latilactobacillus sakei]|uniref:hypothetical protein n=1 Tax=Latilactobacillus sakei TaxID=1599 RepID=UPI003F53DA5D